VLPEGDRTVSWRWGIAALVVVILVLIWLTQNELA
jgi:hypothetical protein